MGQFERFVSFRYLFARGHRWMVSAITLISIAGVTVGVAALIIVLGVIDGIDRDIFGKIVDVYPHLKIAQEGRKPLADAPKIIEALRGADGIDIAEPIIAKQALFERGAGEDSAKLPGQVIGAETLGRRHIYNVPNARDGSDIRVPEREILLGRPLAVRLQARPGDRITIRTGIVVRTANGRVARARDLTVAGILQTGMWDFDASTAFVSLETARWLFGEEGAADYVQVKLKDPFAASGMKSSLAARLGEGRKITTWEEENGEFFQALWLERVGLFVVLLLVVLVASFNIIGTLILMVIEKKREVGILKAMGASDGMVRGVFLSAGTFIGLLGTAAGLALGLAGCYAIRAGIHLPSSVPEGFEAYNFNRLPVLVKPVTVALILACSLAITLAAAIFPAAQAARLNPVEALRHD